MASVHASSGLDYPTRYSFLDEMMPLLRRLQSFSALANDEVTAVEALARGPMRSVAPLDQIHKEGDCPPPMATVSGWAYQQQVLPDGRRQIISFMLPGDILGAMAPCPPATCDAVALTQVTLVDATLLYSAAAAGNGQQTGMAYSLRAADLMNQWILTNQVIRLGAMPAYERLGNLLLELYYRLQIVGLADQGQFASPLTHRMVADVLGLSRVHVARIITRMQDERLVEFGKGVVVLPKLNELSEVANWTPPQVHSRQPARPPARRQIINAAVAPGCDVQTV